MEQAIRDYANQGYDLIIGHSNPFADPAMTVAEDYSDTWFVVTNGFVQAENVASFNLLEVESHYLAGVLAGLMTESNTIGVVGGVELPNLIANFNAFEMGVESVNVDAEVVVSYVGDWGDPALGKETALAQIDGGADFILDEAAGSGLGILEACAEENIPVISYVNLGDDAAPEQMVATLLPDFEAMILDQVERYLEGELEGQNYRPDLTSGVIRLPMDGDVPDDVQAEVVRTEESIVNGEIEVPEVFE
jgi:basic membrane protein A